MPEKKIVWMDFCVLVCSYKRNVISSTFVYLRLHTTYKSSEFMIKHFVNIISLIYSLAWYTN